jgi:hypothetical protein
MAYARYAYTIGWNRKLTPITFNKPYKPIAATCAAPLTNLTVCKVSVAKVYGNNHAPDPGTPNGRTKSRRRLGKAFLWWMLCTFTGSPPACACVAGSNNVVTAARSRIRVCSCVLTLFVCGVLHSHFVSWRQIVDVGGDLVQDFDLTPLLPTASAFNDANLSGLSWQGPQRTLLVSDSANGCVHKLKFSNAAMMEPPTVSRSLFHSSIEVASGVAWHGDAVYVLDSGADCVHVFEDGGSYSRKFGNNGSRPGQFSGPKGIATSK